MQQKLLAFSVGSWRNSTSPLFPRHPAGEGFTFLSLCGTGRTRSKFVLLPIASAGRWRDARRDWSQSKCPNPSAAAGFLPTGFATHSARPSCHHIPCGAAPAPLFPLRSIGMKWIRISIPPPSTFAPSNVGLEAKTAGPNSGAGARLFLNLICQIADQTKMAWVFDLGLGLHFSRSPQNPVPQRVGTSSGLPPYNKSGAAPICE